MTTVIANSDAGIDKENEAVLINRADESYIEIVGVSLRNFEKQRTSLLKYKAGFLSTSIRIELPTKPGLAVGMVAIIPLIGIGVESRTMHLSLSDDNFLIVQHNFTERTIVPSGIPVVGEYVIWLRCKKIAPAHLPNESL